MEDKTVLTDQEFCSMVGISRVTAYRLREAGELSHYRIGNKIRYGQEHVREFLNRSEQRAKPSLARQASRAA